VIVGFNGEFLCHDRRLAAERLAIYASLGKAAAESSSVPCGLIFNECPVDSWVLAAAEAGFNLVMPTDPSCSYDDYARRLRQIVAHAHAREVAVEAEIGQLPCGMSGSAEQTGQLTDPDVAARLVSDTGVDLLAVSVGNIHLDVHEESDLDLERLAAIHARVPIPLVLHGGTGIAAPSLQSAVRLGVAKVNFGTYLKQRYLKIIREMLVAKESSGNPHQLLGMGGPEDCLVAGRFAVRDAVLERIELLGCCGRA
jgi:fructose/tagatose bisphosphate aldolase